MNAVKVSVIVITLLSLIVYLIPIATTAEKFYYLPFRAFEITAGSLLVFVPKSRDITKKAQYMIEGICLGIILFLLCTDIAYPLATIKLLLVVSTTTVLLYMFINTEEKPLELAVKRNVLYVLGPCVMVCLITSAMSGFIYLHAGVVRDVPELGIEKSNVHRGLHAEY